MLRDFTVFAKIVVLQQETAIGRSTDNRMKEMDTKESGLVIYLC